MECSVLVEVRRVQGFACGPRSLSTDAMGQSRPNRSSNTAGYILVVKKTTVMDINSRWKGPWCKGRERYALLCVTPWV